MPAIIISITITGETASAVSLRTLADASTGTAITQSPALPQAMTDAGGGQWTYTFTDTGADVYDYTYRMTWADGSFNDEAGSVQGTSEHYGSRTGIEDIYGVQNVIVYADLEDTQDATTIANRIDRALTRADVWIRQKFNTVGVTLPVSGDAFFEGLAPIADEYAGAWLYSSRAWADDKNKAVAGIMQGHMENAGTDLDEIIFALKLAQIPGVTLVSPDPYGAATNRISGAFLLPSDVPAY